MNIRPEVPADATTIANITAAAFEGHPHSTGIEVAIINGLRSSNALTISLVAEFAGRVIGHIAFSPVTISSGTSGWFGLGPVSVEPSSQGQGVGSALIREGLSTLRKAGAAGCVLVGEPAYYERFGFRAGLGLTYPGLPPEYFMSLSFSDHLPTGVVTYHAAFSEP